MFILVHGTTVTISIFVGIIQLLPVKLWVGAKVGIIVCAEHVGCFIGWIATNNKKVRYAVVGGLHCAVAISSNIKFYIAWYHLISRDVWSVGNSFLCRISIGIVTSKNPKARFFRLWNCWNYCCILKS